METDIDPRIGGLDAVRGLTILRLTQEGLANVAKHAGTTASVRLSLRVDGDRALLEIVDDGGGGKAARAGGRRAGRAEPAASMSSGHGILGMSERVALLSGRLEAGPAPGGRGWRLFAELPPTADSGATAAPAGAVAEPGGDVAEPGEEVAAPGEPDGRAAPAADLQVRVGREAPA